MPIEHAIHETAGQRRERYESRRFKQSQRKWARNHAQKLATGRRYLMDSEGRTHIVSAEHLFKPYGKGQFLNRHALERYKADLLRSGAKPQLVTFVIYMLSHSDFSGKPSWPSMSTAAQALGKHPRTIQRWRKLAEDAGWITVERENPVFDEKSHVWSRPTSNRYFVVFRLSNFRQVTKELRGIIDRLQHLLSEPHQAAVGVSFQDRPAGKLKNPHAPPATQDVVDEHGLIYDINHRREILEAMRQLLKSANQF